MPRMFDLALMRSTTEGEDARRPALCFLPLRGLRRHLPLAGEDY